MSCILCPILYPVSRHPCFLNPKSFFLVMCPISCFLCTVSQSPVCCIQYTCILYSTYFFLCYVSCFMYPISCMLYPVVLYFDFVSNIPVSCILHSFSCVMCPVSCILCSVFVSRSPVFWFCIQYPCILHPVSFFLCYVSSCFMYPMFRILYPVVLYFDFVFNIPVSCVLFLYSMSCILYPVSLFPVSCFLYPVTLYILDLIP